MNTDIRIRILCVLIAFTICISFGMLYVLHTEKSALDTPYEEISDKALLELKSQNCHGEVIQDTCLPAPFVSISEPRAI